MTAILHIELNGKIYNPDNAMWVEDLITAFMISSNMNKEEFSHTVEMVRKGIEENIHRGLDFHGSPVLPLSPATIQRKKNATVFYDTGKLYNSVISEFLKDYIAEVKIESERAKVAVWLNQGTRHMVARPFFGIRPETNSAIIDYLKTLGYKIAI